MNAHPAPTVSGKYISGDRPLWCTQVIPLVADGTSSNGNFPLRWVIARQGEPEKLDSWLPTIPASSCFKKVRRESVFAPLLWTVKLRNSSIGSKRSEERRVGNESR